MKINTKRRQKENRLQSAGNVFESVLDRPKTHHNNSHYTKREILNRKSDSIKGSEGSNFYF